jgi:isopentenyl diphosphate isomerase/L-lactate dehydrogenase-like FMN-dependent dehydrogenase
MATMTCIEDLRQCARRKVPKMFFDYVEAGSYGIRSGQDIMRALALGACSCLIGRAYVYGLGASGERGVARAIQFLHKELAVTMALCGVNNVREIGRHMIA